MNRQRDRKAARGSVLQRLGPGVITFLATLGALPVNAGITLPTEPLATGSRVPPNILFILDDSGSMAWRYMYNPDVKSITGTGIDSRATGDDNSLDTAYESDSSNINGIYDQNYITNTLYYNPGINYQPWVDSDGTPLTGGMDYGAAYADPYYVPNADAQTTSGLINLANAVRTFYVPKANASNYSDPRQYYRYQILTNGRVVRSERLNGIQTGGDTGQSNAGCDTSPTGWGWRNCTYVTPTGRQEAAERTNFATWYSYHRTRTKAAKAGAGRAFSELGADVRVGFRTITGLNGTDTSANSPTHAIPIPVGYNQGLFANPNGQRGNNNNRARWYNRLYGATAINSGTPLRSALNKAGLYFSQPDASGPYGPEIGAGQLQCRQNFTILTTDGYWNGDSKFSSGGNQDGSNGTAIARPDGSTYTYIASRPYSDGVADTLADVAMRYWKRDLRTDMSNIVPSTAANPAFWQHMVTFGISIGQKGNLNPQTDLSRLTAGTVSWPTPVGNRLSTIDDLWHASVNGHGQFLAASNPAEFTTGLRAALASVTERTSSFSNVSANSTSLDAGALLFQANYVSGLWTGELTAYGRSAAGDTFSTTPAWRASAGIPTRGRKLFTSDGSTGLVFPDGATSTQLAALTRTGDRNYPVTGANNAAYIAGDRSRELSQPDGTLRNRNHLLGDIVSSSPIYVRETNTVYVGANDGMLHAINASNGSELFAFIPNGINWSDLGTLSRPDYTHRYFVDGPIVISNRTQTPRQNILVGALGKGGKGIFALDVTSPDTFTTTNIKWEVTADNNAGTTADNNLGLVQSKPIIAKLNNGQTGLIVANGINSTNGRAVLLIYNLDTGALIRQLDTGVGSPLIDASDSNGLSAPVGWDSDGDGTLDTVYAGDRLGNLWKFDLSSISASGWQIANSGNPMFTAVGPDGSTRQPITSTPIVATHPTRYTTWVFFGTGSFMTTSDVTSRTVQSLYGIVDANASVTKAQLTQRNLVVAGSSNGKVVRAFQANAPLPATSNGWYVDLKEPPAPGTAVGERVISAAQIAGSTLVVSSIIPTADACQSDGRGYLNALDAFTGTSTPEPFFDVDNNGSFKNDTLPAPSDTGGGNPNPNQPAPSPLPIGSVDLGVGMPTLSSLLSGKACIGGSGGNLNCIDTAETRNVGRVSWREVMRD